MKTNYVEELRWRGMLHDLTPGTEERLGQNPIAGYAGFDPTSTSLQIGNLVAITLLVHLQRAGHKPFALVGGATGMIGDPSGKAAERELLTIETVRHNAECIRKQLEKFLDFDCGATSAEIVNNYDWFAPLGYLEFLRDVGKHLTLGYMIAKDSVQSRMEAGISYTEFSYQLLQAYDFYWLYKNKSCELQVGGSDQWGNITAGTELIRRMASGQAYALTCPLITRADGTKFGKTAGGEAVFLDPKLTTPYRFYQFWLNASDDDAAKWLRIFSLYTQEQVQTFASEHQAAPHSRALQRALARDLCVRVHSQQDYDSAVRTSEILFGDQPTEALKSLSEQELLAAMEGVPRSKVSRDQLTAGIPVADFLSSATGVFASKGEARRMLTGGGVLINKQKVADPNASVNTDVLLQGRYVLVQRGKKNYHLVVAEG
jgi:tyrosyl-tRNA synthetase